MILFDSIMKTFWLMYLATYRDFASANYVLMATQNGGYHDCATLDGGSPYFEEDCKIFCFEKEAPFCDFSANVGCKYTLDKTCTTFAPDASNTWKNLELSIDCAT